MYRIVEDHWSFQNIRAEEPARADRLECAPPPEALLTTLTFALAQAVKRGKFRIAVDSKSNKFIERRTIVQFQVPPEQYDWFFNARTGYRAHFWISYAQGLAFNEKLVRSLSGELSHLLPNTLKARCIEVETDSASREERDLGVIETSREEVLASLYPKVAKVWICERRYDQQCIENIGLAVLIAAERGPKLCIPRWSKNSAEGLRAPFPDDCCSWLDLKGGFLDAEGNLDQVKPQTERARQIHRCGWS